MINLLPHSDVLTIFFEKNKGEFFNFSTDIKNKQKLPLLDIPYNNTGEGEFHIITTNSGYGAYKTKIDTALKKMEDSQYYYFDIIYTDNKEGNVEVKKVRYTLYFTKVLDAGYDEKTKTLAFKIIYKMTNLK